MTVAEQQFSEPVDLIAADDAAMGAIWEKAQADGVTDDETVETTEPSKQTRGSDGKFAKAATEEPAADDKASLEGEDGAAEAEGATVPVTAAPAHLPQAIKASWDKIPEDARKALVDHQAQQDKKFSEIGRQMEQSRPIVDRINQAVTQFPQFAGMTPERLAQGALELAAIQASLDSGDNGTRVNTILQIAHQYGVLPHLAAQVAGGQVDQRIFQQKPVYDVPREPEINIDDRISSAIQQRDTVAAVDAFAATKEFYADVEAEMPHYVSRIRELQPHASLNEVLEAAYDMAINANPTTRQKVREAEAAKAATIERPDTKRADAAKKAASINVKPTINGKERQATEEEAMAAAYDRMMAT